MILHLRDRFQIVLAIAGLGRTTEKRENEGRVFENLRNESSA